MKILFDHPEPALLAHGGMAIQIRQTKLGLESLGCEVEHLRWWDESQQGDIIHYFGRMPTHLVELAQRKGIKVVLSELLTVQGSRTKAQLRKQRLLMRLFGLAFPGQFLTAFRWRSYEMADACIALTSWEAHLMDYLFRAPPERIHVVPNGVEEVFRHTPPVSRGAWLVCTATITERKRVAELAEAAALAQTPLWVIGRPYSARDPYAERFAAIVQAHPKTIRYAGSIEDREALARIYRAARGFVLCSACESLSLSALEATASECPLLLSDLPWARSVFADRATYCPADANRQSMASMLRAFYDRASELPIPPQPLSWVEVARKLAGIYGSLLQAPPQPPAGPAK